MHPPPTPLACSCFPGDESGNIVLNDFTLELQSAVAIEFSWAVKGHLRLWSIVVMFSYQRRVRLKGETPVQTW